MKKVFAIVILIIILLLSCWQAFSQDVFEQINKERIKRFRRPLEYSERLETQSHQWLITMHKKYNGKLVHGTIRNKARFEVLTNADNPVSAWMNSKPHRQAILSRKVRKIGIASFNGVYCARLD